ncbi:MAG: CRISPR-associated helicase Cas3' [Bacillota bacterium]
MNNFIFKLWAKTKPFHPLYCHLIDVGNVALALLETNAFKSIANRFCEATGYSADADKANNWLAYLTALHDIGKCHANFQAKGSKELLEPLEETGLKCQRWEEKFRHEAMSAEWLIDFLIQTLSWSKPEARTVSAAIRGHHGNFQADTPDEETEEYKIQWEPLRIELEGMLRRIFLIDNWVPRFKDHSVVGIILSGLLVLSDWIASNNELFGMEDGGSPPDVYAEMSMRRAKSAIDKLGLLTDISWVNNLSFCDIWPKIPSPRPIQACCEILCSKREIIPGMAIIEAPMGEGKTEAAIYLASQWLAETGLGGIYIALPTAATSNQMYGRFKEFLEAHDRSSSRNIRLVHGMSWLLDEETPQQTPELSDVTQLDQEQALDWFRPKKRSLLASYGVGTIDQALMSVLNVKHGFLRLFGLAGKVLIIDEVHAYDAYMSQILVLLLKWCGCLGIPVILLSATLPGERRKTLIAAYNSQAKFSNSQIESFSPYPLLTFVNRDGRVREEAVSGSAKKMIVKLEKHSGLLSNAVEIAGLTIQRATTGGCFCVIANTVISAQEIYRELKQLIDTTNSDIQLLLFHARFPVKRRQEIEEQVLALFGKSSRKRPEKIILVATQVVEQSLDLDFDEMFSEIAPIDLILQRVGRLHRHDHPNRPTGKEARLHLFTPEFGRPDFGSSETVYQRFILLKTLAALTKVDKLELPEDIRGLIEYVYDKNIPDDSNDNITDNDDYKEALKKLLDDTAEEAGKAEKYLISEPYSPAFKLNRQVGIVFDEDEGEAVSYFTAKTRIGDDSIQLLVLESEEFLTELKGKSSPCRRVLKEIYQHTVNVPRYWVHEVKNAPGYEPLEKAPVWMPGVTILRLVNDCWRGFDRIGKEVIIRNDFNYGMILDTRGE